MRALFVVLLLGIHCFTCTSPLGAADGWVVGGEAGLNEIHEGEGGGVPRGMVFGLTGGHRWRMVSARLSLTQALGEDSYVALEPGLEVAVSLSEKYYALIGAGGGFLREYEASTLSLPYYGLVGLGIQIRQRMAVRAVLRLGRRGAGDEGSYQGPHALRLGLSGVFD